MGAEVAASEVPKVNGKANSVVHEMENGKANKSELIAFGSQGVDEPIAFNSQVVDEQPAIEEVRSVPNSKNAADEWPAEPIVHYFWIVKYRPHEDPKLKAEMEKLDKEIDKKSAVINQIYEKLNPKRVEKDELYGVIDSLGVEKSQYQEYITQKRREIKPLTDALGDMRGPGRDKGPGICSSEEELNRIIRSLEYQIQHESMPLKEEKQILREIKELEATRPKVVERSAARAKDQEKLGQKEAIQEQVKLIGTDLDGVKKQKEAVQAKRSQLQGQAKDLKDQIKNLKEELDNHKKKKNEALQAIKDLKKKREEGNKVFYENRALLNNARELAAKKDVKALEDLVHTELEKFMTEWNGSKAFRSNYEKRILLSLDMRQLSRDGRMRNFDEKPLVKDESPAPSEPVVTSIATGKTLQEIPKTAPKAENVPTEKAQNEPKKGNKVYTAVSERSIEDDFAVEKPKKVVSKDTEVDAAKLKEMKKEEEKEKQRQTLERKKKLQEKAAAKAALRAQKEAEKKQKEREKKLKKKEGSSVQPTEEEQTEIPEADEAEKSDNVEEPSVTPAPSKAKGQKEAAFRNRKSVKTRATLPKAILRKKSPNYLFWGSAAAAAVVVLFLVVFGYNYLQKPQERRDKWILGPNVFA